MTPDGRNRHRSTQRNCDSHNDRRTTLVKTRKREKQLQHQDVGAFYNKAQGQHSALHMYGKAL